MARLFSAIELPDEVRAELADGLAPVRAATPDLRWLPPELWHITLGFYGDGEDVDRRGAWVRERVAGRPAFRLRLRAAGRFPRILWIGVDTPGGELGPLAAALVEQREQRPFVPHLTVAKWKADSAARHAAAGAAAALDGYRGRWWLTDEVVLFRSELTADGPVYTAEDRVALGGAPDRQH